MTFSKSYFLILAKLKLRFRLWFLKLKYVQPEIDDQNPYTYPIVIISFDQLSYLKQLVNFLLKAGYQNIVIIDNASTYKPLLTYLKTISQKVRVHKLSRNFGHMVFWRKEEFFQYYGRSYYVVTDPDILPVKECPNNFLLHFKNLLDKNPIFTKVGFSLKIDDLPEANPYKNNIKNWEEKFWQNRDDEENYIAEIDTTFALYPPDKNPLKGNFFKAIRVKWPFCAHHGGWYVDPENLTEEQKFYYSTAQGSASWKININGELENKDYH